MYKRFLTCLSAGLFVGSSMVIAQLNTQNSGSGSISSSLLLQSSDPSTRTGTSSGLNTNLTGSGNLNSTGLGLAGVQNQTGLQQQGVAQQQNPLIQQPNCIPTAPTSHTDFEQFIAGENGDPLPVFGRNLFSCLATTFAPVDHIPVPADYVIGPNDEIDIQIWGAINEQQNLIVDRNGQIALPQVGVLNVAGVHSSQLTEFLRTAVSRIYKNFKLSASLGQLRSIQVYVFGNVNQPGVYTVSSLSTLVNTIFAAGGPSATGSMRHLELRRGRQLVTDFDLYDLAISGDKSRDVKLLPGDVIFVPPVGEQIALIGNFNQPAIYELRGKTTLAEAVHFAGGLTAIASTESALLEHITNKRRQLEQLQLEGESLQHAVAGGDVIRVFPVSPEIHETVTLRGNVNQPRRYAWHEGMRIADLIPNREMLITRRFWHDENQSKDQGSNSLRFDAWNANASVNPFLPPGTQNISGLAQQNMQNTQSGQTQQNAQNTQGWQTTGQSTGAQSAAGSVQAGTQMAQQQSGVNAHPWQTNTQSANPTAGVDPSSQPNFTGKGQMGLLSDLQKRDAEINWDYAVIERLDKHDLTTHLIPFNLGHALEDKNSVDNQQLQSGDIVSIFGRKDIAIPMEKHVFMVQVAGEVNAPGVYRVKPGETLMDMLHQAGGLTHNSYLFGLVLNRVSTREMQQQQLNASIDQMRRDLIANYTNSAAMRSALSASPKDGTDVLLTSEQGLLDQLSTLQPTGRVVLKVKRNAKQIEDVPDFALEDGDSIVVPSRLNTVQVVGAVFNQTAFRYVQGKSVKDYLRDAGGPSRDADTGHMYVLEADGSLINSHSNSFFSNLEHMRGRGQLHEVG
jgi:protein involved in polysaccharide export with SLBB domain